MNILEVKNLRKVYNSEDKNTEVVALKDINFEVEEGEFVAIMGESGSGKSTLLNLIASLDTQTAGDVILSGENTKNKSDKERAKFRREKLGFVYQDFSLLSSLNNRDNIFLPLVLANEKYKIMKEKLAPIAKALKISNLLDKFPYQISGGQKQRVAVARALITHPQIVLADEPTGALDSKSTDQLLDIFDQINEEGQTIVMVTHSTKAASYAKRVLFIRDGQVFHQIYRGNQTNEQMYQSISDTLTLLATGGK